MATSLLNVFTGHLRLDENFRSRAVPLPLFILRRIKLFFFLSLFRHSYDNIGPGLSIAIILFVRVPSDVYSRVITTHL